MIEVIQGDSSTYAAHAYGTPNLADMEWCNQYTQQKIASYDPWLQQHLQNESSNIFNTFNYQRVHDISRALTTQDTSDWLVDGVHPLRTVEDIQNAPPVMVEWIMANPTLRDRFHRQTIAGYDESYENACPKGVGEDHYFYRLAMEGLVVEEADGESSATEWFDEVFDDRYKLEHIDKVFIQQAWAVAIGALHKNEEDPTSRYNAQL